MLHMKSNAFFKFLNWLENHIQILHHLKIVQIKKFCSVIVINWLVSKIVFEQLTDAEFLGKMYRSIKGYLLTLTKIGTVLL